MISNGYSQRITLNNGDTTICFSIDQGRWLLKQVYTAEYLFTQDSINTNLLTAKDSLISSKYIEIQNYKNLVVSKDSLNSVCNLKLDVLSQQNKILGIRVKKEKRAKIIALLTGVVSTTFFATLYVTK